MNDLDLVRTLRADVPSPAPARVAAGRDRLLAATVAPPAPARRPRRLIIPIGAIAAAAAAAVAVSVTVLASGTHPAALASSTPPSSHPVTSPRLSLPAQVLTIAANKVASEPVTKPTARQWVYSKLFQSQTGVASQLTENWERFDGSQTARLQDGRPVIHDVNVQAYNTPLDAYNALVALPSSPAAIRATADQNIGTTPRDWLNWAQGNPVADSAPTNQGQAEFDYLAEMLWVAYAAAPANAQAHVYEAMAVIRGVTVDMHATTAAGQPAIGVSDNGGDSWVLLDPQTYRLIGLTVKATPFMKAAKGAPMPNGTISMAYEKVALVGQAGER